MATILTRPVKRCSQEIFRDRSKSRNIIITMYPSGFIGFRLKGTRREETLPITTMYTMAVRARVLNERCEKAKTRKAKRKGN